MRTFSTRSLIFGISSVYTCVMIGPPKEADVDPVATA